MPPPQPQPQPPLPELMDDLVEDILLRFPPDDPASLARAALVSKRRRRLISGDGFRRRLLEFHRSSVPPLLGFLCNRFHAGSLFVPTPSSSFRPPNANRHGLRAVHAGHGRVLLRHARWGQEGLVVWDPISDEQRDLPMGPSLFPLGWNAAVLCAAAGGGCDHLGCHRGPFLVVFVGAESADRGGETFCRVYSSEDNAWREPIYIEGYEFSPFEMGNSVLIGSALYFKASSYNRLILKYDLLTHEMSPIHLPVEIQSIQQIQQRTIMLIATEDGRLGLAFAAVHESNRGHALYLWSREHGGPDNDDDHEGARWAQDKVLMLDGLKIVAGSEVQVVGFAGNGSGGVVFLWTGAGVFTVDLKSGKSKKVGESIGFSPIVVPYVTFCTPELGEITTDAGL